MLDLSHIQVPDQETLDLMLAKTKGRLFMMKGAGFLGSLLCNYNFIWDEDCPTAWCNGDTIAFNPRFFTWLSADGRVMLLAHELWHTGFDHMSRLDGRCPDYWNKAADFVINNMLDHHGYSFEDVKSLDICLDHQYDNMTTEQVYDLLGPPPGGGGSQSLPMPGNSPPTPGSSPGASQSPSQDPSQDPSHGSPQGGTSELSGDLRQPTQDQSASIKSKLIKAIQSSRMSREAGIIPGETSLLIEKFLDPILPWETLLAKFFTDISQDDYSWKRPSRRYEDEYLPSPAGDNRLEHLIYYLDVSGSISDHDILRFNSEVRSIHKDYNPKRLTLVTFDTKIQDIFEFTEDMPFEKIEVHGRGGTSLVEVRQHIERHRPTAAIIFSDLYVPMMDRNPGSPILWIVTGNKSAKVPFGRMIHIDR